MDWPKAKSILLAAFLIMNIFLLQRNIALRAALQTNAVSPEELHKVEQHLATEGIVLTAQPPAFVRPMSFLKLQHQVRPPTELVASFWPNTAEITVKESRDRKAVIYSKDYCRLIVYKNGLIDFTAAPSPVPAREGSWDRGRALTVAEAFARGHGGMPADASLDVTGSLRQGEHYVFHYIQKFEGFPIFTGRMLISVNYGLVDRFSFLWFNPIGFVGQPRMVIPVTELLIRVERLLVQEKVPVEERVISDVTVGYYSESFDAYEWEAIPAWRVRLQNGTTFYFNAYTGDVLAGNNDFPEGK